MDCSLAPPDVAWGFKIIKTYSQNGGTGDSPVKNSGTGVSPVKSGVPLDFVRVMATVKSKFFER
jgi:hypothetical protein